MKHLFHPEAKEELKEAVKYYNECGSGPGYIFLEEERDTGLSPKTKNLPSFLS